METMGFLTLVHFITLHHPSYTRLQMWNIRKYHTPNDLKADVWGSGACMMIVVMIVAMIVIGSLSSFQIIGMRPATEIAEQRSGRFAVKIQTTNNALAKPKSQARWCTTPEQLTKQELQMLSRLPNEVPCTLYVQVLHKPSIPPRTCKFLYIHHKGILTLSQLAPLPSTFDLQAWPQVNKSIGLFSSGKDSASSVPKSWMSQRFHALMCWPGQRGWQNAADSDPFCQEPYKLFGPWL